MVGRKGKVLDLLTGVRYAPKDLPRMEIQVPLDEFIALNKADRNAFSAVVRESVRLLGSNPSFDVLDDSKAGLLEAKYRINSISGVCTGGQLPASMQSVSLGSLGSSLVSEIALDFERVRAAYRALPPEKKKELTHKPFSYLESFDAGSEFNDAVRGFRFKGLPVVLAAGFWNRVDESLKEYVQDRESRLQLVSSYQSFANCPVSGVMQNLDDVLGDYEQSISMEVAGSDFTALFDALGMESCMRFLVLKDFYSSGKAVLESGFMTAETRADLEDIIEHQFPLAARYLVEEAQNSMDAHATLVRYSFFADGLKISDNGKGMSPEFLVGRYPIPQESEKDGEGSRGRFGLGSRAKLVEVLKGMGEVIVKSNSGRGGFQNRYFMSNGRLWVGFSRADMASIGTEIGVVYGLETPYSGLKDVRLKAGRIRDLNSEKSAIISDYLKYVDHKSFGVFVGRKRINSGISPSAHGRLISSDRLPVEAVIDHSKKGFRRMLSGGILVVEKQAQYDMVASLPVWLDPVEGRRGFRKNEKYEAVMHELVRGPVLSYMEGVKGGDSLSQALIRLSGDGELFESFFRAAAKDDLLRFFSLYREFGSKVGRGEIVVYPGHVPPQLSDFFGNDMIVSSNRFEGLLQNVSCLPFVEFLGSRVMDGWSSPNLGVVRSAAEGYDVLPVSGVRSCALPVCPLDMGSKVMLVDSGHEAFRSENPDYGIYLREMCALALLK